MDYEIALAPAEARALRETLAEAVAAAVTKFILGALSENPHRVGKELRPALDGV